MCGLIGVFQNSLSNKSASEIGLGLFENQHKRGQEGFGIVHIDKNNSFKISRATEQIKFIVDLYYYAEKTRHLLVHHRNPTSTPNLINQTHPIFVSNQQFQRDYLIIHNGIVVNCDELKKEHIKEGFLYTTNMWGREDEKEAFKIKFNDSESFAIEIAKKLDNKDRKHDFILPINYAFIAAEINKETQTIERISYGRSGSNPLYASKGPISTIISSEGPGHYVKEDILHTFALDEKMEVNECKIENNTFSSVNSSEEFWSRVRSSEHNFDTSSPALPAAPEILKAEQCFLQTTINETIAKNSVGKRKDYQINQISTPHSEETSEADIAILTAKIRKASYEITEDIITSITEANFPDIEDVREELGNYKRLFEGFITKINNIELGRTEEEYENNKIPY